uniref:nicotinate phosphoribosyltransferase n=1 Tax=Fundulus heteroclitus TaxID=8078 RepID=A0A3Q2QCE6_FUNHE
MEVEGPLAVVQLLETSLLCLVNYASLVCSNAARFRLAAGHHRKLLEMGLRRAQGPDGGLTASRYTYIGGFDLTSNVQAGFLFGIPVVGTMAHSYVTSFSSLEELLASNSRGIMFPLCLTWLISVNCLYIYFSSGLLNFCAVALVLCELGYQPVGVRLDSGDLCKQSTAVRRVFGLCSEQ